MTSVLEKFDPLFNPETAAVVGASDNPFKLGYYVMKSITEMGFKGEVIPVKPDGGEIMGLKVYASLLDIPGSVDLVVVVVPAQYVLGVVEECVQKKVKGVVIISSGFREIDDHSGEELQARIAETANRAGIPIIGPNTFGIVNCNGNLNATFSPDFNINKGDIAVVGQSGGMTGVTLGNFRGSYAGFSKIVGLGNRCNTDFADIMAYLIEDPETGVICSYMEGIDDPRRLIETARIRTNGKPIIIYKSGRSSISNKAARSHTGSMAGRYEIYQSAFRQAGIIPVDSSEELADSARILCKTRLPRGNRTAILVAQAGLGIVAGDICEQRGLELPALTGNSKETVDKLLPPMSMRSNPIDLALGWYSPDLSAGIIQALADDPDIDALMIMILVGGANTAMLDIIARPMLSAKDKKPIVTCFLGEGEDFDKRIAELEDQGIVNYPNPERAAVALSNLVRHANWLRNGAGMP